MVNSTIKKILEVVQVKKRYGDVIALNDISIHIDEGEFVSIQGPSGCGKTTLLSLMAGLDIPSSGSVLWDGLDLSSVSSAQKTRLRAEKIGFIFQSFRLIPNLTAWENVRVPLEILGQDHAADRAREAIIRVGLEGRLNHYPHQLSGGECQRIACARAFVHQPTLIFADEPTGNLDEKNAQLLMNYLIEQQRIEKVTLVLVSHDPYWCLKANRIIKLSHGTVVP